MDISEYHIKWYKALLDNISSKYKLLIASGFSEEEINFIYNKFHNMLDLFEKQKLSGVIIFAQKP